MGNAFTLSALNEYNIMMNKGKYKNSNTNNAEE